jgi:hypothetical protein
MGTSVALRPQQIRRSTAALIGIKAIHTLAWFSIESCMIYLLYAGLRKRSDRRAAIAAAVVGAESLITSCFRHSGGCYSRKARVAAANSGELKML